MTDKYKRLLFQTGFILISLVVIEIALRKQGYKPGDMKPNWLNFKPVDTLEIQHHFYTNSEGLFVADSVVQNNFGIQVNSDGFRSPCFCALDSNKKRVLLIGDSFTWGMSAQPVENNCYADLLRNETDFEIINTGIPAADPVQYAAIAQKYIPALKPDYVLVMFFMGNDLMMYDRPSIPGEPYCYPTNAGAILADIDGKHFSNVNEAYRYVANDKYYLKNPTNFFEKIIAKSALLSRLYSLKYRFEEKIRYEKSVKNTTITKKYLNKIKQVCSNNQVPVKYVLIPEIKEAGWPLVDYVKKYEDILQDTSLINDWVLFENSKDNFMDYPDAHLNNKGHRYYADKLKAFLKNTAELK